MPDDSSAYEDNKYKEDDNIEGLIMPLSDDPGEGAVLVERTGRVASGITYELGPKEEKSEYRLLSHVWTIGSSFVKTSQSVVIGVAEVVFSELEDDIIVTMPAAAQVSKSYSNIYNMGKVHENGNWKDYVLTHYRETFTHEYGSYASTFGYTKTYIYDYTGENGYNPVETKYTEHYYNNTWIADKALYQYSNGHSRYDEYVN
jgi:hypothetical protein